MCAVYSNIPAAEHHKYFLYVCESDGQVVLYAVLFGYKGLLQALALLVASRTRNVKVKGLDDSVYIAASIYVTSVVLAVIIVSTYTLMDYVNAYPAVVGMGLLLGTTAILGLVFIPRVRNRIIINPRRSCARVTVVVLCVCVCVCVCVCQSLIC